jgi:hypothetical protein
MRERAGERGGGRCKGGWGETEGRGQGGRQGRSERGRGGRAREIETESERREERREVGGEEEG